MRRRHGSVLLSPTDLNTFFGCRHASALDYRASIAGEKLIRAGDDEGMELVQRRGDEHEKAHFEAFRAAAVGEVVWLEDRNLDPGTRLTEEAMRRGAALIFQGVLADGVAWHGYSDFLIRSEVPSPSWPWSYEVHDTKLARSVKAKFAVQLAVYADLVARIQGTPPPKLRVVLGDGNAVDLQPRDYVHYVRRAMRRLEASIARAGADDPGPGTVGEPCATCPECGWRERCGGEWKESDHLHAVCNIRSSQIRRLRAVGVDTVAGLASLAPATAIPGLDPAILGRLRSQATLQVSVRGVPNGRELEMLEAGSGRGMGRLTPPDPHDLFFDMEGDPLYPGGSLEYMFGVDGVDGFQAFWGLDRAGEKTAFEAFMDHASAAMDSSPAARIYHYNHYETTALKRLAMAHGTREAALDRLLREERFVDLYVVVREAMRTSEPGLSLKNVERFYRPAREGTVSTAGDSIVAFERWLEVRDQEILDGIEVYNRDDCLSTRELRDWLVTLRPAGMPWGERAAPTSDEEERVRRRVEEDQAAAAVRDRLLAGVEEAERPHRDLVANLCDFHRREGKPEWWALFQRKLWTDEDCVEDLECLGGLEAVGQPVQEKRSLVQEYRFPEQDTKLDEGSGVVDAATGLSCGNVRHLDLEGSRVKLGWGSGRPPLPRSLSLGPSGPIDSRTLRDAIRAFADSVVAGDGRHPALEAIVRRDPPRLTSTPPGGPLRGVGETTLDAALRACRGLDGSYLFIQGPPGTGKTWTASRVIVDALRRGLRVGVSAFTHKAINNLLLGVERAAAEAGFPLQGFKKSDKAKESTHLGGRVIVDAFDDRHMPVGAALVGGTAWFWSKEDRRSSVDLMVVDEAGQVSLANLVAIGTAARNIVLVGDQMQLEQPVKGVHPGGSGVSALEHLLQGAAVVLPDRGIFLDETRRMHPAVCGWVSDAIYDGRLTAHPSCAEQRLLLGDIPHGALAPAGLGFVAVEHEGCSQHSAEEVSALGAIWGDLLRHSWRGADGVERAMTPEDILVVAPWNVQVNALRRALPPGARVGTVDRFQGQEAAVVLVSMATSGTDAIPRGMGFLFSRERLNVAVSRARCLALVLASPRLLEVPCTTVDDMRLVNTLCWLADGRTRGSPDRGRAD